MNKKLFIRIIQLLAGCAIAGAGLYIFFKDVNPQLLWQELRHGSPVIYALCTALSFFSIWIRALRWRLMLPDVPGTHKRGLFSYVMIGFMVNNILPARLGEAMRVFLIWKKNGFAPATAVGAFVLERVIDLVVFGSFFIVPVVLMPQFSQYRPFAFLLTAGFTAFIIFLALMRRFPGPVRNACSNLAGRLPGKIGTIAEKNIQALFSNLDWLQSGPRVLAVALLSYATTLPFALEVMLLSGRAGGLGFLSALYVQANATLGAAIPLSPGYVGTLHEFMLHAMTQVGIEPNSGRAITIMYHALTFVPVTAAGLYYFFKADLHFSDINRAQSEIKS